MSFRFNCNEVMNFSLRLTLFSPAAGGIVTNQADLPGFELVHVGNILRSTFCRSALRRRATLP